MNCRARLLLSLFLFLCIGSYARSAVKTWYVATLGDDAATGSVGAPFKTITHALSMAAPGDTVLIRGGKYGERWSVPHSGLPGKHITVKAYPGERPVIDGSHLAVTGWQALITLKSVAYIDLDGLDICNFTGGARGTDPEGVFINGASHDITIRNCNIYNIRSTSPLSEGRSAHAILVVGSDSNNPISNLVITGCTVHDTQTGTSENITLAGNVDGFTIGHNTLYHTENIGIIIAGGDGLNPEGAVAVNYARNGTISDNVLYNISMTNNPDVWGADNYGAIAIYVCGGAGTVIERNKVYECDRGIGLVSESNIYPTRTSVVRNNFVSGCARTGIYMGDYLNFTHGGTKSCYVVNNTLSRNNRKPGAFGEIEGELRLTENCDSNVLQNNIVYAGPKDLFVHKYTTTGSHNIIDHNQYYGPDSTGWLWQTTNGTPCRTLKEWQTMSGMDAASTYNNDTLAPSFSIGRESFLLNGKAFVIRCGEMHYARIPKEYWRHRLKMAKAMGLNTICAYLFWNFHEPAPGRFTWTGDADAAAFCRMAKEEGLYVLLRPGPYACAEWDFGGFPWWLLQNKELRIRTQDPYYMERSRRYLQEVGRQLAPLQIDRGGNIIMVQVENEYGSFGTDTAYVGAIRDELRLAGFTVPFFTCDPRWDLKNDVRSDIFSTVNFGSDPAEGFKALRAVRPEGPLMVSEYYPGWFDSWGEKHRTGTADKIVSDLRYMLERGASFSIYMVHGGTSFGLWAGANADPYKPETTSYDYDAPIDEQGRATPKYYALRELLKKNLLPGESLPEVPASLPVQTIKPFFCAEAAPILPQLKKSIASDGLLNMEDPLIGQGYGDIVYETTLPDGAAATLDLNEVHDFVLVYFDQQLIGTLDRRKAEHIIALPARSKPVQLKLFVEAMGRVNFGQKIIDRKGLTGMPTLTAQGITTKLSGWTIYPFPLGDKPPALQYTRGSISAQPALYKGWFVSSSQADVFLDLRSFKKGMVWVNGRNIGRYWNIGPTRTLYLPGVWLKKGANEVVVLDLYKPASLQLKGLPTPILSDTTAIFEGVMQLAKRRVPWLAPHLSFRELDPATTKEQFELTAHNGKVEIAATGPNAAAVGLNWYLKYYCHRSMSHMGDNLAPLAPLPEVKTPVRIDAAAEIRYALNYCTYNYSFSFYDWKDWERELDWMALNGVNTMLVANGAEAVWQNVLHRLGYTQQEIDAYITGPAYNAWWLMGNIQGWGGPMPASQIDYRQQMVAKMIARMRALGIAPVMPAFYGMVPSTLKDKLHAHIITQGTWGAFTRPDILDPADTAFERIGGLFYEETKRLYGDDLHYFSGDPFHEGGITDGVDLGKAGKNIQSVMQKYFPGAVWVLQGWQVNPRVEMLVEVDRSKILVQELFGETTTNWEKRKAYEGTPFIWCMITNYGERPGLFGKLQRFADEPYRAANGPFGSYIKGIGIMPEGIDNNPVSFDCMLEVGWHREHMDIREWIKSYALYRYGKYNDDVLHAWQIFLQTIYNSPEGYQEGPPENILCARPALQIKSVSTWGTLRKNYDIGAFQRAVALFEAAAPTFKGSETYAIDLINFKRQALANRADTIFARIVDAWNKKDLNAFNTRAAQFLRLSDETETLLDSHPYYRLSTYQRQALAAGHTPAEKRNNLHNAMMLVTYWGENDPKEDNLHEYAYKEWAGMMTSFYKRRWELFFEDLRGQLKGRPATKFDWFHWEREWEKAHEKN